MKTLVFEGAGWEKAPHNGVGNCRIRTRIKNDDGQILYLEINGFERGKYDKYRPFAFTGYVAHCFSFDCNESSEWRDRERDNFEYSPSGLLKWVNAKLRCSFEALSVINDGTVQVHETAMPLCNCNAA